MNRSISVCSCGLAGTEVSLGSGSTLRVLRLPFSSVALAAAREAGRPAIVDFTARWCLPCRENDTITFSDPAVGAEASRFVMLRADLTEMTDEMESRMAQYNVLGVPTIVFYGSSGAEEARTIGFVEPERLLALMQERH
mgnify:CR=1 FL=1